MKKILLSVLTVIGAFATADAQCVSPCSVYTTTTIPFSLSTVGTNSVAQCDDCLSPAVPIGFTFNYMCNTYTSAIIGSNGFVALNPAQTGAGCCSGGTIPSNDAVNGMVALFWTDLYNSVTNSITYNTIGSAPNRTFVVTYSAVPVCCSTTFPYTGQIKMVETSGVIELHIASIPNSGNTVSQGIENIAGTIGYTTGVNAATGYTATNIAYRYTPVSTSTVPVASAPSAISGTNTICAGTPGIYSVTAIPTASAYAWSLPGGWSGTSTTNTISVTPSATGVMSVTASYTACGTSAATTQTVNVNSTTVTVNSGTICPGGSFTITPAGASTYTFQGGTAVKNPTASTNYTVVGTSTAGCVSNVATSSVTVGSNPTITVNSGAFCTGGSFTMVPSGATTYTFSSGSAVVSPTANASYSVTGTNAIGCISSNTAVSSVTVNVTPTVTAITSTSLICTGQTASLTAGGASTYTWNTAATTTVIAVSPTVTTSYTVTGAASNGCSNVATITQSVSACTGILSASNGQSSINVYPNPSNGVFTIDLISASNVTVVDVLSKVVYTEQLKDGKHNINLSNLKNGIYILKAESNGVVKTVRLVKD